jgi:peptidoglycan/xylan/chitin deacetylase (PgdA/CDA1 family)
MLTGENFWFDRIVTPIQVDHLTSLDFRGFGLKKYHFHPEDGERRWVDIGRLLTDLKSPNLADSQVERKVLDFLRAKSQPSVQKALARFRPLNTSDLRKMAKSDLCTFGSHSHDHVFLDRLDNDQLMFNLRESKKILEETLENSCTQIAYPYGKANEEVQNLCRQESYELGFLTSPAFFTSAIDPLGIPRLLIGGYDTVRTLYYKINRMILERPI